MDKMTQEQTEIRAKRRAEEDLPVNGQGEDAEETLRQDGEEIDVDFVFSSLTDLDFHGLKTLLRQGFGSDAEALPLSAMAEALLAQQGIGTAVKVDDTLDPYAVMSVLVLSGTTPETIAVTDYLRTKATAHCADPEAFETVLKSPTTGLLVHDRLLNMPPQLAPPMIRMLMEEMAENPKYAVQDLILLSKVYHEVDSEEGTTEEGTAPPKSAASKKRKKGKQQEVSRPTFFFHPEDEIIQKYARMSFSFSFTKEGQVSDSRRVFSDVGIEPFRNVLVIPRSSMEAMLMELDVALA